MRPEQDDVPGIDSDQLQLAIDAAASRIVESDYVVAMTGAGMSVESGIPTFRGKDGLWTRYGEPRMDGYVRFKADPVGWWNREVNRQMDQQIIELREALSRAEPHEGHRALADLEEMGALQHVVTQNIDGLDLRTGLKNLTEIHGNRTRLRCIDCGHRQPLDRFVREEPPEPCPQCHGVVKFDTVMFGEPVPADTMASARDQIDRADCVVAIGTSATVRPASGLLWIAEANGAVLIEINPHETRLTSVCDHVVRGTAREVLPLLAERVAKHGTPHANAAVVAPQSE